LLLIVIILDLIDGDGLGLGMRAREVEKLGEWLEGYGMRGGGNVYG